MIYGEETGVRPSFNRRPSSSGYVVALCRLPDELDRAPRQNNEIITLRSVVVWVLTGLGMGKDTVGKLSEYCVVLQPPVLAESAIPIW